jgi:hypothetical protein
VANGQVPVKYPTNLMPYVTYNGTYPNGGAAGAGGGAGSGNGAAAKGGGGGSGAFGGGVVHVNARFINRGSNSTVGVISCVGSTGGTGGASAGAGTGGGAGGGGGGGGYIYILYEYIYGNAITNGIQASGGNGGTGGTAGAGTAGGNGIGGAGGYIQTINHSTQSITFVDGTATIPVIQTGTSTQMNL